MKDVPVTDLMIPLEEYPTVSQDATLHEAILALGQAQKNCKEILYPYRAVLVHDEDGRITGKLDQFDILQALELDYTKRLEGPHLSRLGLNATSISAMFLEHDLWSMPVERLCEMAGRRKVAAVMHIPSQGEYLRLSAPLQEAVHHLVLAHNHSLLLTEGREVVGILRLSDVFASVCEAMEQVLTE